jgi:hypothetical protein
MQHLDEGTIHAWLDGALPPEEATSLEEHIAECDACARAIGEARGLIAASSRILSALDVVPAGVLPPAPADAGLAPVRAPRRWLPPYARVAAAVVFVAAGAFVVMQSRESRTESRMASSASNDTAQAAPSTELQPPAAPAATPKPPAPPAPAAERAERRVAVAQSAEPRDSQAVGGEAGASALVRLKGPTANSSALEADAKVMSASGVPQFIRLLRTDTVASAPHVIERKVYEVRPGLHVTLEIAPSAAHRQTQVERRTLAAAPMRAEEPTPRAAGVNSIQWTDSTRTEYTLSGPLPIEELQKLKALVH